MLRIAGIINNEEIAIKLTDRQKGYEERCRFSSISEASYFLRCFYSCHDEDPMGGFFVTGFQLMYYRAQYLKVQLRKINVSLTQKTERDTS